MKRHQCRIVFPKVSDVLDQDQEWIFVERNGRMQKIRLHNYGDLYRIPGLYEELFYEKLGCDSPNVVCRLLARAMERHGGPDSLRVLDFGAGNGMVAEKLNELRNCEFLVGIDILEEAKEAAERDRPGLYDRYMVLDLAQLDEFNRKRLQSYGFNTLVTVAALGFNDIPSRAFLNAFNLMRKGSWIAFNIRDKFLSQGDDSGYRTLLERLQDTCFRILDQTDYCHRRSITGRELCYRAIVGQKTADADIDGLFAGRSSG
ncbi:Methyltransferase domain-containing protein [Desulfacinum hydrothermale DSM 13146]|uniref:Methyltransferase domain-containing protein n=1 Tax=Desulfacinum hydrothermale DSM 13146 TaxID=1121390 RepID=A0A1W1XES0_9BACT|nr:class I SAM-dependent methyltransferase [Desulfacinum hydrothermale]SMC22357.1 Methyltransferase domain-containing protein [Desulfacinum hydrothermale DSM 13146]